MKLQELIDIEYKGWYVESTEHDVATLRSDYTEDSTAEIYIKLEKENYVEVSYSGIDGDGIFFHGANLTPEEVSQRTMEAADNYFDYQ
jgi:hypothetical protein